MADGESTDTHEGQRVGEVAQQYIEQFEECSYKEHAFFFWHSVRFFLNQFAERFFESDQDQRNDKHYNQNACSRNCMTCHKQEDNSNDCTIKYKTGNTVCIKEDVFSIFFVDCIDNMQNHRCQDQEHTKSNGNNESGIHRTDKRKCCHSVLRMHPEGRYHIFKTEETAEQETEDRGKDSGTA